MIIDLILEIRSIIDYRLKVRIFIIRAFIIFEERCFLFIITNKNSSKKSNFFIRKFFSISSNKLINRNGRSRSNNFESIKSDRMVRIHKMTCK